MKKSGIFAILSVIAIAIIAVVAINWQEIRDWSHFQSVEQSDSLKSVVTTYDVVSQRRIEIQVQKVDSIYYQIPEPALISIIDFMGTKVTREDVVKQYLSSMKYYNGITTGALNSNHFIPDSLPNTNKPQIPQPVLTDTIKR